MQKQTFNNMFVFRNYTVENLFDKGVTFSGYGDVQFNPGEHDRYVWFYLPPVEPSNDNGVMQIEDITAKLQMVAAQISATSELYVLTLVDIFSAPICLTDFARRDAIGRFNETARRLAVSNANIKYIDFQDFVSSHGKENVVNWRFYFVSRMLINPSLASSFKVWWRNQERIASQPRKKCIVLDLDNTLWHGILGEDGMNGIKMSGEYPGNAFEFFQDGLVRLAENGVIIAICSKNNESDVNELWDNNPFVKLTPKYISARRINWQNKADNIVELANELNIGLDSMVFVDDNPVERELVRTQLPSVAVPDFPEKPYSLPSFYQQIVNDYFSLYRLTDEDRKKTLQYKTNALRNQEKAKYTDLTSYIKSLETEIDIRPANEFNIVRMAQMSQKTNQFNLTTRRYTESDIVAKLNGGSEAYCISVRDRFGDNGITGMIIFDIENNTANIDTLLLSCRILGRDIERAFVASAINRLFSKGITEFKAVYIPTAKNRQVSDFYEKSGFKLEDTLSADGVKQYSLTVDKPLSVDNLFKISIKE